MPRISPVQTALALLAGSLALIVVHSLGRFAFTPLLPHFLNDGLLSLEQGARLATWNYVGYLFGALSALVLHAPERQRIALPVALCLNSLITLAQGFTDSYVLLWALRLLNGISNGLVFVLAPALVLEWLSRHQQARLSGLVYLGFAFGLLISNVLANAWDEQMQGAQRWWPMAALALPLAVVSALLLARLDTAPQKAQHSTSVVRSPLFDRASTPLFIGYAGAGLGYILPMTFLPTLAQQQLPAGDPLVGSIWYWTALACMGGILLWNYLSSRWGDRSALCATYAVQAVGAVAPLVWPGSVGISLCALLVGCSFVGSVFLTQRLARTLQPHQGPRLSAALIALYGVAQLLGPWLAEVWLSWGGTLTQSFALGAGALLWAWFFSWLTPSQPSEELIKCPT